MRLPKMTRHKRGQGVVRIRGRDYYCGKYGTPEAKSEYERLITEFLANKAQFGPPKESLLVADLVIQYNEHAKESYGPSEANNIALMSQCVLDLYSDVSANDLGAVHFKTIRATFAKGGRSRSRQYVNKIMRLYLRMIKWCIGEELITKPEILTVLKCIAPLKQGRKCDLPESKVINTVDPLVVKKTIEHLPPVVADMVRFQELVGCRPCELCSLRPNMIVSSKTIWEIDFKQHKTMHHGHSRIIYVGPRAQAILAKYLDRDPDSYCFSPGEAMSQRRASAARVTPANQGNRRGYNTATRQSRSTARYNDCYNTRSYGHAIRYACRKAFPAPAGLDDEQIKQWHREHAWSPNQLRHNAGTDILEQFSLEHVAANHGHASVETSKIYARIKKERAIEVAKTR